MSNNIPFRAPFKDEWGGYSWFDLSQDGTVDKKNLWKTEEKFLNSFQGCCLTVAFCSPDPIAFVEYHEYTMAHQIDDACLTDLSAWISKSLSAGTVPRGIL